MKRLKMGMIGGGEGAFIGAIHRMAAAIEGNIELVAGAFSQNTERSKAFGDSLGITAERCYSTYDELIQSEKKRPLDDRIDFVAIVTPNNSHFKIAQAALTHGFHVFCEKPATMTLDESLELKSLVDSTGLTFGLAHAYAAYPMVIEARSRVAKGEIGEVFKVMVDYSQGWLAPEYLQADSKQASWRMSAEHSGISCCMGDIGVHAANLAEFIIDGRIERVLADLASFGDRELDDDGSVLLRFNNDVRGTLSASQICVGEENNLTIRIYGDKGSLKWQQQNPNTLLQQIGNEPVQILRNGFSYLSDYALGLTRTPSGHPEGYIEAFANLYRQFYQQLADSSGGNLLPDIEQGVAGMAFIEAVVESNKSGNQWVTLSA